MKKNSAANLQSRPGNPSPIPREEIEWCNIWVAQAQQDEWPRLLLIGDSITCGYYPFVAEELRGRFQTARFCTSACVADPLFLLQINTILQPWRFDCIQFNNGLHGFEFSDSAYRDGLLRVRAELRDRQPTAVVTWANCTPLRDPDDLSQMRETNQIVVRRNPILAEVAAACGDPITDLYQPALAHPEWYNADATHFTHDGYRALTRHILHGLV